MTVKELINELLGMPLESTVILQTSSSEHDEKLINVIDKPCSYSDAFTDKELCKGSDAVLLTSN